MHVGKKKKKKKAVISYNEDDDEDINIDDDDDGDDDEETEDSEDDGEDHFLDPLTKVCAQSVSFACFSLRRFGQFVQLWRPWLGSMQEEILWTFIIGASFFFFFFAKHDDDACRFHALFLMSHSPARMFYNLGPSSWYVHDLIFTVP